VSLPANHKTITQTKPMDNWTNESLMAALPEIIEIGMNRVYLKGS